jgi:SSS family solute:Na+ symporter
MREAPEHFKMIAGNLLPHHHDINKYLTFPGIMSYVAGI